MLSDKASVDEAQSAPKILGLQMDPSGEFYVIKVVVNLSKIVRGQHQGPPLKDKEGLDDYLKQYPLSKRLSLRIVYVNWDPIGGTLPKSRKQGSRQEELC